MENIMDPFDWLSLAGRMFPRLVAIILVVAFIGFPRTADAVFMWAVHVRAAQITSEFDHALDPMLARLKHGVETCRATSGQCSPGVSGKRQATSRERFVHQHI
jgi:hypothetical protein